MSPFFSIIMPVYNNEKYFPIAVESVLNQSFADFELIIVDDGSTDKTGDIADSFAKKDKRVRVIHQENQWIYASFNNGIAVAEGKYFLIVNSDDTINKDSLKKIYEISNDKDIDIIFFNLIINRCDENQNIIKKDVNHWSQLIQEDFCYINQCEVRKHWCDFIKKKLVYRQCVYKTSVARKYKYRNDVYNADQVFYVDIAPEIESAAGLAYVVYNHFIYDNTKMNASVNKYYGYEHKMFNDIHMKYVELFKSWNLWNDEVIDALAVWRLENLTTEIRSLRTPNCTLNIEEKLKKAFIESIDEVVYSIAKESNRIEEMESRVLSECRELLMLGIPDKNSEVYFIYEMLEALLRYEKTTMDMEKIKNSVYNEKNPFHIGESFYKRLINSQQSGVI